MQKTDAGSHVSLIKCPYGNEKYLYLIGVTCDKEFTPGIREVIRQELNRLKNQLAENKCTEVGIFPKD